MNWEILLKHILNKKVLSLPFLFFISATFTPVLFILVKYLALQNRMYKKRMPKLFLTDAERREIAILAKMIPNDILAEYTLIAKRDTIERWFNRLVKCKFDYSDKRKQKTTGRKRKGEDIRKIVIKMAKENPTWGYQRIADNTTRLDKSICANTVKDILNSAGIPSAKERKRQWQQLHDLKSSSIWCCDFIKQKVATSYGILTYHAMVFLHIGSRKISISQPTLNPTHKWVNQQARNQVHISDWMDEARFLIRDNDILYPDVRYHKNLVKHQLFDGIVGSGTNIEVLHTAYKAPKMNAFCERVIRTIREEAGLSKKWPLHGVEDMTRRLRTFQKYYNTKRHHQGLKNNLILEPLENAFLKEGEIKKERSLELLSYYYRKAS